MIPIKRFTTLVVALGIALTCAGGALANGNNTVKYDVAMNGFTFSFEGDSNPAGFPAVGTPFIIRGYIYPGGTFKAHGAGSGVLPDGRPEFPDRVLGTWYCRGWHLQDGDALVGPVVATTQVFEFNARVAGSRQLITDGIELADFGVWFERSVTGGTGKYADRDVRVKQIYVDFNATNSFNTSFAITLD
jgi:hypothetical protein